MVFLRNLPVPPGSGYKIFIEVSNGCNGFGLESAGVSPATLRVFELAEILYNGPHGRQRTFIV
jgi:hypothetical protein